MHDRIEHAVSAPLSQVRAFELFVDRLAEWWPPAYTWSQEVLVTIGIEPRLDGLCFERGPYGFRCDWGRVLAWDPPNAVALAWQISPTRQPEPNPERASIVTVRFTPEGVGCRIHLLHQEFARHGEGADAYRAAMGSAEGWPYILQRFVDAAT